MVGSPKTITEAITNKTEVDQPELNPETIQPSSSVPGYEAALNRLRKARERFLTASIAFCDGAISEGQLRAARELLRDREQKIALLEGDPSAPFIEESPPASPPPDPEVVSATPLTKEIIEELEAEETTPDLKRRIITLDQKIAQLENDFQQGRINASQYRAVRRHYLEQREVALRMQETYPESNRWQIVLEEGKTTFLMQLNEATCRGIGFYEIETRGRIYAHGSITKAAEDAMALLGTFSQSETDSTPARMFATQIDDGSALLLIPGRFTVCLSVFSQSPPAWQVRALREVHRNYEAANRTALQRKHHKGLIFPDLSRFVKSQPTVE